MHLVGSAVHDRDQHRRHRNPEADAPRQSARKRSNDEDGQAQVRQPVQRLVGAARDRRVGERRDEEDRAHVDDTGAHETASSTDHDVPRDPDYLNGSG